MGGGGGGWSGVFRSFWRPFWYSVPNAALRNIKKKSSRPTRAFPAVSTVIRLFVN